MPHSQLCTSEAFNVFDVEADGSVASSSLASWSCSGITVSHLVLLPSFLLAYVSKPEGHDLLQESRGGRYLDVLR